MLSTNNTTLRDGARPELNKLDSDTFQCPFCEIWSNHNDSSSDGPDSRSSDGPDSRSSDGPDGRYSGSSDGRSVIAQTAATVVAPATAATWHNISTAPKIDVKALNHNMLFL
ncbi:hypothetical protein KUCAC02_030936 [Chaenocephalus aceratus]|uniref:Uncharacterized protein n=1 Tax=Chaenocephalus aceratus TaxID=36190 RepID=A0ACB9XMJ2_CHAAC|nr:hypothetical protein KUCAC02_030936 [Chaenocephalus aceratus]